MKKLNLILCFLSSFLFAEFPIISEGKTHISFVNSKDKELHSITCHEKVQLDFNFNYIQCLSSHHDLDKQVHFHDKLRDLYSDHLRATYVKEKGHITLDQLKIYGHVCLIQKESPNQEIGFDDLQYATADQLDFDYHKDEIILRAKEGSSVVFFDQINDYRITAPAVKINKSMETQKPLVHGLGKVHFVFEDDKIEKLKAHFLKKEKDHPHE